MEELILNKLEIRRSSIKDLDNIVSLWNDGEVMKFVGFPNGIGVTKEQLSGKWLDAVTKTDKRVHYSIYYEGIGYCGESHYHIVDDNSCALDIKLLKRARGKNIAFEALKNSIENAFKNGAAYVYVDPSKKNIKAVNLYNRLGFKEKPHPDKKLRDEHYYYELRVEDTV